jgi:hypothetical protein
MCPPRQIQEPKKVDPNFANREQVIQNNGPTADSVSEFLYPRHDVNSQGNKDIYRSTGSNFLAQFNFLNSYSDNRQQENNTDLLDISFQFGSVYLSEKGLTSTQALNFLEIVRKRIYDEISRGIGRQHDIARRGSESLGDAMAAKISELAAAPNPFEAGQEIARGRPYKEVLSEMFFGLSAPDVNIWDSALRFLDLATAALKQRLLDEAISNLKAAGDEVSNAHQKISNYNEGTIKGAERSIFVLEVTKALGSVAAGAASGGNPFVVGIYAGAQNFSQQVSEKYLAETKKEIDWGSIGFDVLFNLITAGLGNKMGAAKEAAKKGTATWLSKIATKIDIKEQILKGLSKNTYFSKLSKEVFAQIVAYIVSGRANSILQNASKTAFDKLRGKKDITLEEFISLMCQELHPDNFIQDLIWGGVGHAANMAVQHSKQLPSSTSKRKPTPLEGEIIRPSNDKIVPLGMRLPAKKEIIIDAIPTSTKSLIPIEKNLAPTTEASVVESGSSNLKKLENSTELDGQSSPNVEAKRLSSNTSSSSNTKPIESYKPTRSISDNGDRTIVFFHPGDGVDVGISKDSLGLRKPLLARGDALPPQYPSELARLKSTESTSGDSVSPEFSTNRGASPEHPEVIKDSSLSPEEQFILQMNARNGNISDEKTNPFRFPMAPVSEALTFSKKATLEELVSSEVAAFGLGKLNPLTRESQPPQPLAPSIGRFERPVASEGYSMAGNGSKTTEQIVKPDGNGRVIEIPLPSLSEQEISSQSPSKGDPTPKGTDGVLGSIESDSKKSLDGIPLTTLQHDDVELNFSSEKGALGFEAEEIQNDPKISPVMENHLPENRTGNAWKVKSSFQITESKSSSPESVVIPQSQGGKADNTKSPEAAGKAKQNPLGKMWDHKKFPIGVGKPWDIGDPIDMPSTGVYPVWSTIRERIWKTLAHNELEARLKARKSGMMAQNTSTLLELDPVKSLTDLELQEMLESGTGREGFEVEHRGIPQRVITLLEGAGLAISEARRVAHLGDPNNLEVVPRELHAIYDEVAADMFNRYRNPELPSALDDRRANPLGSANDQQIMEILDSINKSKLDLGKTVDGRRLRDVLQGENARRGNKWIIP